MSDSGVSLLAHPVLGVDLHYDLTTWTLPAGCGDVH